MILDKQVRTLLYAFTTREKMDKWIIIDPVLPPPRIILATIVFFLTVAIAFRRKRFPSWYLFRASLLVINSCVINESCTGKVQLPMQRWFPTPPFRPLFLFSFFNDPPVDLLHSSFSRKKIPGKSTRD